MSMSMNASKSQRLRSIKAASVVHQPVLKRDIAYSDSFPPNTENTADTPSAPEKGGGKRRKPRAEDLRAHSWWTDFEELVETVAGWGMGAPAWKIAAYIAWASSPLSNRKPVTADALATDLGLKSARSFRQWRDGERDPEGRIDAEIAARQAGPLVRHRRDLYDALIASATQTNEKGHQDRKLAFEMLGDYRAKQETDLNLHTPVDIRLLIERAYGDDGGRAASTDGESSGDAEGSVG